MTYLKLVCYYFALTSELTINELTSNELTYKEKTVTHKSAKWKGKSLNFFII